MKRIQKLGYMAIGAVLALILSMTAPAIASNVSRQITAYYNDIRIYVDGELITPRDVNGNIVEPFVSDGTTYLPVRAVGEAFGKTVEWDGTTQSVFIGLRPGSVQYMPDIVPAYQVYGNYSEYSALRDGGVQNFSMGGVRYVDGMTFHWGGGAVCWAVYNLNGQFTSLSGVLGTVDGQIGHRQDGGSVFRVFADSRMVFELFLSNDMHPRDLSINVAGVNQLKIELTDSMGTIGIGNPIIQ